MKVKTMIETINKERKTVLFKMLYVLIISENNKKDWIEKTWAT